MSRLQKILLFTAGIPAVAFAGAVGAQELMDREFNVVGSWSTSNLYPDYEVPFWTESLPEASGERLTATIQAFDQVGLGGGAVYEMVEQGVYDVGATVVDYVAGDDPRFEGQDLPAIGDPALSREIVEAYRPHLERAFDETYDVKVLSVVPFTSQVVFCNTEISSLEDFAGKRIRGSGRMTMDFIEAAGGTAVSVAFDEVTIALERGVIDCGITGALSGYLAGWAEVATHFYPLPAGGWDHVATVMRNDVWNELDEATQNFLQEQFAAFEDEVWGDAEALTQVGINCNTGGDCPYGEPEDMTLVELTDEDQQLALQYSEESVLPRWAERCPDECIENWNETVGQVVGISIGGH